MDDAGAGDLLLLLPFRVVVRRELLAPLARPECAHEDEALHSRGPRRGNELACALLHHAPDGVRLGEGRQSNEVDDRLRALGRAAEAVRIRHVALDDLAAPGREALLLLGPSGQHADRDVLGAERVDDVPAHEACASDDEDGHSKFFQ